MACRGASLKKKLTIVIATLTVMTGLLAGGVDSYLGMVEDRQAVQR